MTSRRFRVTSAAGLLVVVAMVSAACGPGDHEATPTTPPATTTTTEPTTTTTTALSQAEKDEQGAEAAVVAFWRLVDELAANPKLNLVKLTTLSQDKTSDTWYTFLTNYRRRGQKQIGHTDVVNVAATKSGPARWDVDTCIDVSKVNVVDTDGKSVVSAERSPTVRYTMVVTKEHGKFYLEDQEVTGGC